MIGAKQRPEVRAPVVGLDGTTFRLIGPRLDSELLPFVARLRNDGTS